jgi:hypothetical protein
VKFAYYKDWCRFPIDPVLHPVWEELVMLLPGRPSMGKRHQSL